MVIFAKCIVFLQILQNNRTLIICDSIMKNILRPLVALAVCAAAAAACTDPAAPNKPADKEQTVNTWVFNDGDEIKAGSVLILGTSDCVTVLFSAEEGLATARDLRNADDCTEIKFPVSAVGSDIDLTELPGDGSYCFTSRLQEFGKTNGIKIDGKLKNISEGRLSSSLENGEMSIRCEFTTLSRNTGFSVYLCCPFKQIVIPEPDGNSYEYDGKAVEFKSVHAFSLEDGGKKYFGFYAAPEEGLEPDDIMMSEHRLGLMVDEASLSDGSVLDRESGRSIFDVQNLPDGCELQMTLVNGKANLRVSVPGNSVSEGTIVIYLTGDGSSRILNAAGNIALKDGKVLKMSCVTPVATENSGEEEPHNEIEYTVKSRNISEKAPFRTGFYSKNTWDDGISFTYSVSGVNNYIQLGGNTFVEIYAGTEQLLNGKAFDVARTSHPFSFMIDYVDIERETSVQVKIDNNNRAGASGTISFKQNKNGLYDAQFDLTLDYGDITVKGNFSGGMKPRNIIYTTQDGKIDEVRSASLDVSGDPCILYMSAKNGTAGPEQYDIKCEVPASEWKYGIYMAFGSQSSAVTWIDGFRYSAGTSNSSSVFGGNWRVLEPISIPGDGYASECRTTLYGNNSCFAYYYGEIKIID